MGHPEPTAMPGSFVVDTTRYSTSPDPTPHPVTRAEVDLGQVRGLEEEQYTGFVVNLIPMEPELSSEHVTQKPLGKGNPRWVPKET